MLLQASPVRVMAAKSQGPDGVVGGKGDAALLEVHDITQVLVNRHVNVASINLQVPAVAV